MAADGDYEVGYGKPPVHTQFQKGRSGNPRGRPRRARPVAGNDLERLMQEEGAVVTENGTEKKISRVEALFRKLVERALKGDFLALLSALGRELKLLDVDAEERGATRDRIPEPGGIMLVPAPYPSIDAWEAVAVASQARLAAETFGVPILEEAGS